MRIGLSDLLEADLTEVLRRMLEAALAGVGIGWSFGPAYGLAWRYPPPTYPFRIGSDAWLCVRCGYGGRGLGVGSRHRASSSVG